ncbi:MAG: class I SAM-dependent methyltransferase [Actinomycetota bacterium]|nr:class I SAM-dependent methyltransferase [Actinomycetota bacterium]MDK1026841.1 class I SAM-dependent methyltransferase [Actinomycetota bacterium]MDK1039256.1 class I SAM-dependent methyltransferase [Actinomycetota bacterium]MDK1097582.1 class I SAM-dependent methyltransferase [Actinomycetota bacterium]MDK1103389.1 class I SAM-dependent methyltransferase [Actinomycetota bacterium]
MRAKSVAVAMTMTATDTRITVTPTTKYNPSQAVPVVAGDTAAEAVASHSGNNASEQAEVTRRYNRMARIYDIYDAPMEMMGTKKRRRQLLGLARGSVLEVGVGTGKNLPHYREDIDVTGIDVSSQMLSKARDRAGSLPLQAKLMEADVQDLPFDDDSFDTAVGTCVFCSVADPVQGLRELGRVVRPDGRVLLLEHVRPQNHFLGRLADFATVLTRRIFGFRANRRTEENVVAAGLEIVEVTRNGIWRTIVARPGPPDT